MIPLCYYNFYGSRNIPLKYLLLFGTFPGDYFADGFICPELIEI